jgi:hypothetical protein
VLCYLALGNPICVLGVAALWFWLLTIKNQSVSKTKAMCCNQRWERKTAEASACAGIKKSKKVY